MARWGDACFAGDFTPGVARAKGNFAALMLDAGIPALSREGALEALGGQLDFSCDTLTLGLRGVESRLEVNDMVRYISSVADFDEPRGGRGRGSNCSASVGEGACARKRPNLGNGGIRLSSRRMVCAALPILVPYQPVRRLHWETTEMEPLRIQGGSP